LRIDILRPMIGGPPTARSTLATAAVLLAVSAAAVYALVVIYPKP
jgi:hypothetical protein